MAIITVDGIRMEVEDGANVLNAALANGVYIPHLCHHKDLNPLGSCRMCIVQVEGREGVTPSCMLKAEDGMVITTKNEEIEHLRMLALELLLAGHPEDCSTCPKYGHCELQTLIQYIGPKTGRLKHRSKGFNENKKNPLIVHDMNRCVLCGRCVRACNEMKGCNVLQYNKREDLEMYVGTLHDKLLKDADCRFCQSCVEVCSTGTIRDILANSGATKEDSVIPCKATCPAHTEVPKYIRFTRQGNYDAAVAVVREKTNFPMTLGYICTHACEAKCKRGEVSDPMAIRDIKRYIAEHDTGRYWKGKQKQLPDTGKKVCVVGAGPAGLTAAFYLRKQGHDVTVKEALPTVGGFLCYGIPSYRLPREIVAHEVEVIREHGVKIETNAKVNDFVALTKEYDAVLLALGNHKGVRLPMTGSGLTGVTVNIDFLEKINLGIDTGVKGKNVIVLGGGNVAFDCARSARRLGAKDIHLACLEARNVMTADDEEIEQAQEEGIFVHPAQTFEAITGTDHVTGVDFMNVESFTFDENRRAIIRKEPGSEHHIDADMVIFATGQWCDVDPETVGLKLGRANSIAVNNIEKDKTTSVDGIFAAGDCIYGTKSVIQAIQSGREAASQIDLYLGGDGDITEKLAPDQDAPMFIGHVDEFAYEKRKQPVIDPVEKRIDNFNLFNHGLCDADICGEASRCLQCDLRMKISAPTTWVDYTENKEA